MMYRLMFRRFGGSSVSGRVITSEKFTDHNTFEKPDKIKTAAFTGAKKSGNTLSVKLPAKSVVVLEIK